MVSHLNQIFIGFERRAEGMEIGKLVNTFVDIGAFFVALESKDHQVIHGRRGTGKTHALSYLAQKRRSRGDLAIIIDARTLGSNASIYSDPNVPITERATQLLLDTLTAIHAQFLGLAVENAERFDLSKTGPTLDRLADQIGQVRVEGTIQSESSKSEKSVDSDETGAGFKASLSGLELSANFKDTNSDETATQSRRVVSGVERYHVNFGSVRNVLSELVSRFPGVRTWLLFDEWSTLPLDLQPYLADMLRRCIFPVSGISVKIAAIEQRSRFKIPGSRGEYIGAEIGADIPLDANLDDFMVFENQPVLAREFYARLFFNHYAASEAARSAAALRSEDELVERGFAQQNVFDELVQAAEGVPRDAMNILSLAAQRALDDRIGMLHVRDAARDWYQRGKERDVASKAELITLLRGIVDDVIGRRNSRAFLFKSNAHHSLIDELFDARILHILKRNISGKDAPGERYDAYKIDYGCYVELTNTGKAPKCLLDAELEDPQSDLGVPHGDYRSIRRAILDIAQIDKLIARPH